jgi:tetratricopeptide (TPR) repeat protein
MEIWSMLRLDGRTVDEWIAMGNSFVDKGLYEEAVKCYSTAVRIDPLNHNTWNSMGLAYFDMGEYGGAIECYNKALNLNPNDNAVWSNKALAFYYLGDYQIAIDCLDTALDLDPTNPMNWNNKGIALFHMGKFEDAIECYDKALKLDPGFKGVRARKQKAIEKLDEQRAIGFEKALNFKKAAELYEKLERWEDAGRCRESQGKQGMGELGEQLTKIDIGKNEKLGDTISNNIQDSVVNGSNLSNQENNNHKLCPYCRKVLDFPELPKYCPHCKGRIFKKKTFSIG